MAAACQTCKNIEAHGPKGDDNDGDQSHVSEEAPVARNTKDAAEEQQSTNLGTAQGSR